MEPQLDNAQVTRLLEIAAAMSSAQEKVTGSGKLDLSGVMAALANQSFLHSVRQEGQKGYGNQESNKYSNNINNSNINRMPMSNSGGGVAGRKAIFEASSSSSSFSSSCSNSSSPDTGKRMFSLPSSSPPSQEKTFTSKNRRAGEDQEKTFTAKNRRVTGEEQDKTFTPPRVTPPLARYGAQSLPQEDETSSSRLADRKAKFETRSVGGIRQQQSTNIPVATVFERKGSKQAEAKGQIVQQGSKGDDDENSLASLPQLLDSRDSQVAQFLQVVTAMAGERAKRTGDGRLDMGGLLEALAAVEGIQVQEKETKELGDNIQNGSLAATTGSKAQSSSWKPETSLTEGRGRQQGVVGGPAVEEGGEEVRQSWQEALRGARRPGGVRGQSEEAARSGGLRGHLEEAIRAGGVKEPDVTGSSRRVGLVRGEGTVLAQPAMATLTPPPPPLPPRDSCPPSLPSSRPPASSSFPSLPSTAPPPTLQRPSQMKASQPFVEEKSSVIGELKNILEDGGSINGGGTLGRSQGSSSGFKLPVPQEPVDTSNPQDPTVKRIVYNQYREMLKSYRTAQT